MNGYDPFDQIRQGNPVPKTQVPDADSDIGVAIYNRITPTATRRPARRMRIVIALGALLALTATAWIVTRQPNNATGVACYQGVTLDTDAVVIPAQQLSPADCEPYWLDGSLTNPTLDSIPPTLIGCVNEAGTLDVFPTADPAVCTNNGLTPYEPVPLDQPELVLDEELSNLLGVGTCLPMADADLAVKQILTDLHLDNWSVTTQPPTPDRPCASYSLKSNNRNIVLVPIPGSN